MYPLTVDHLAILRDRHIDAGAAFGIDQLDGLRHGVGVLAAVFHGFKAKAGPVQMRVLGPFFRCQLFGLIGLRPRRFPSPLGLPSIVFRRTAARRYTRRQTAHPRRHVRNPLAYSGGGAIGARAG